MLAMEAKVAPVEDEMMLLEESSKDWLNTQALHDLRKFEVLSIRNWEMHNSLRRSIYR